MKRKIIRNIILLLVLILLLFSVSIGDKFVKIYQINRQNSPGAFNIYPGLILQFIVYCIAGMIFGLEKILGEWKKDGRWSINLTRLIIIGVPSFLMGIFIILIWKFSFIPYYIGLSFVNFPLFVNFMQMLLGYIIVTSFYKTKEI